MPVKLQRGVLVSILSKQVVRFLCGCFLMAGAFAWSTGPVSAIAQDGEVFVDDRTTVVFTSQGLEGKIEVRNARYRKVGAFTQMQVEFRNSSSRAQALKYKVDWIDEDGFDIRTQSAWKTFNLKPNEITTIQSTGKKPNAWATRISIAEWDE